MQAVTNSKVPTIPTLDAHGPVFWTMTVIGRSTRSSKVTALTIDAAKNRTAGVAIFSRRCVPLRRSLDVLLRRSLGLSYDYDVIVKDVITKYIYPDRDLKVSYLHVVTCIQR